jgi:hypothetical protein
MRLLSFSKLMLMLVFCTLLITMYVACVGHANRRGDAFNAIKQGASRAEVIALLGKSDRVRACDENLWWGDDAHYVGKNDGRCITEERYEYFLTAFGIGYSLDGTVVSKYQYVSE